MRWVAAALTALLLAAPAAAKPDPQVTALKKQVAALTARVKLLEDGLAYEKNLSTCRFAIDNDAFRVVFTAMSKFAGVITGSNVPAWESIPRYDDQGACAAVGYTRP